MILYILLGLAVVVLGLVAFVASRPDDFRITRSLSISAPAEIIFDQVNDLYKWRNWSPWEKMDPESKRTYEGPGAGLGASYGWDGNNKVGAGRMTITESRPADAIVLKLEFFRPFKATHAVEFTFRPQGSAIVVAWSMSGKNSFVGKLISTLMNCDKMIGTEYEKGLASLKAVAEAEAATARAR
jgi:hypothetical protein